MSQNFEHMKDAVLKKRNTIRNCTQEVFFLSARDILGLARKQFSGVTKAMQGVAMDNTEVETSPI